MKKLLRNWGGPLAVIIVGLALSFLTITLTGCPEPTRTPSNPPVNVIPEETPPPIVAPPETGAVKMALYDGETMRFWDGSQTWDAYTGHIVSAGNRKVAYGDVLHYFDDYGNSTQSRWLPVIPDAVLAVENTTGVPAGVSRSIVYQDDIYTLEIIPDYEAYALGALHEDYTRVFTNGNERGLWYMHEWAVDEVIETASGHILVYTVAGHWINLTDNKQVVDAWHGGLLFYDMGTEQGHIVDETGDHFVTWEMNHFDHSVWQLANGVWYTENGYTWTAAGGVISNANVMYCWNNWDTYPETYNAPYGEKPYIITAGVREENGEEVTYWIETVTAKLYRHIPSINRLDMIVELYEPPMTRMGSIPFYNSLDPVIIDGILYYHEGGNIMAFDFTTGLISIFGSDQEVLPW
jgi:hypothetical protein